MCQFGQNIQDKWKTFWNILCNFDIDIAIYILQKEIQKDSNKSSGPIRPDLEQLTKSTNI